MSRVVLNDTELRDPGRPWRCTLRSSSGPLGARPRPCAQQDPHRPASHGCCWWSVQDTTLAQLKEKSQTRPLGACRLPFCFLRTRTLSFWTTMDSGVTSTWASAIGLSGVGHAPAGARFFAAGGCRSGEFCVAIGSQTDLEGLFGSPLSPSRCFGLLSNGGSQAAGRALGRRPNLIGEYTRSAALLVY